MFRSSAIHTVTEFCGKPAEHIRRLREHKRPELLTVNGKAAVVVQDAETYEEMEELARYAESLRSIRQALSEEGRALDEFTAKFEAARSIPR